MQSFQSESCPIKVIAGSSDVVGYCSEDEARAKIKAGKATCQAATRGVKRGIVLIEPEDAPLVGAARQRALDGYFGAVKYTYREELPMAGHSIPMLKRLTSSGQFVPWPR